MSNFSKQSSETNFWIVKFFQALGWKFLLIVMVLAIMSIAGIYISYDLAKENVNYYLLREICKGILISSIIGGVIKWFINREFTKELELIEDIRHSDLTSELDKIHSNIKEQTKQITEYSISLDAMRKSGVTRIYKNRAEASEDINAAMKKALQSEESLSKIKIIGISLNDFTRDEVHVLHDAWNAIQDYVKGKHKIKENTKIEVQALVLDPQSKGGSLRATAESQMDTSPRLKLDVEKAIRDFDELETISEERESISFQAQLYRTSPILYLVWTPEVAFVQQYYFRPKHQADVNIPVIRYVPKSGNKEFKTLRT